MVDRQANNTKQKNVMEKLMFFDNSEAHDQSLVKQINLANKI